MKTINPYEINPLLAGVMSYRGPSEEQNKPDAMLEGAKKDNKKNGEGEGEPEPKGSEKEQGKSKKKSKKAAMLEAVAQRADQDDRALASSLVTTWVQDGSADADDFDALAINMAGLDNVDPDADLTDDQIDAYNDALNSLAQAAVGLGADQDDVTSMIDDDDDDAAERVYNAISGNVSTDDDADDAVAEYTVANQPDDTGAMLESTIKVVRDGKVTLIRKRLRPRRMSALQKAALKKAQMRAHTASGNMARRKSIKIGMKRGLYK